MKQENTFPVGCLSYVLKTSRNVLQKNRNGSHYNMSVGAQMVVILKAFVEHCVLLVLGHPFEFSWLHVSQTDVFHPFLLVSCDSESRSSSFCYQIVVRETENRQLLHFLFQLPNPLLQESPLWFLLGQRQSFLVRGPSLSCPAEPAEHICTG